MAHPSSRIAVRGALMAASVALAALLFAGPARAATIEKFNVAGYYSFVVPFDVDSISVTAVGGAGGSCDAVAGGEAGSVGGTFHVVPGEHLTVTVAGDGAGCEAENPAGGFGGGGPGGETGGGGASSVAPSGAGGPNVADALLVAGGGGGNGGGFKGIAGGNAGAPGDEGGFPMSGGGAGTLTHGGAGGDGSTDPGATAGGEGKLGEGGAGGDGTSEGPSVSGGGGGGGLYGGGGGGGSGVFEDSGGGGGGSSFIASGATNVTAASLSKEAPEVTVTYTATPPTLEKATISHRRLREGHGAVFGFTLSEEGKVSIELTTRKRGLRKGGGCVAPSRSLEHHHARKCERTINSGALTATEKVGHDDLKFSGRIRGRSSPRHVHGDVLRCQQRRQEQAAVASLYRLEVTAQARQVPIAVRSSWPRLRFFCALNGTVNRSCALPTGGPRRRVGAGARAPDSRAVRPAHGPSQSTCWSVSLLDRFLEELLGRGDVEWARE